MALLIDDTADKTTFWETTFIVTKAIIGGGVLSIPFAVGQGGGVVVVLMCVLSCIAAWSAVLIGKVMVRTQRMARDMMVPAEEVDWPFFGFCAYGEKGRAFCTVVFIMELWMMLLSYLVTNGVNINIIFPGVSRRWGIAISGSLAFVLLFASTKTIAQISAVGTFATIIGVCSLGLSAYMMPEWSMDHHSMKLVDLGQLPVSVGLLQFCFVAHAALPSIYRNVAKQEEWTKAVAYAFTFATVVYMFLALLAYYVYGTFAKQNMLENVGRTLSGDAIPGCAFIYIIATACFAINLESAFPVFAAGLTVAGESWLGLPDTATAPRFAFKFMFMLSTTVLAVIFADCMSMVTSLTGCITATLTSIMMPLIILIMLERKTKTDGGGAAIYCAATCVVAYGLFIIIFGSYTNVMNILANLLGTEGAV